MPKSPSPLKFLELIDYYCEIVDIMKLEMKRLF